VAVGSPPAASYGIWRHIPGTLIASAGKPSPALERLQAFLPPGCDAREVDGRLFVSSLAQPAGVFPAGTWELVTSVPAVQQAQYVVAIPTISNAASNEFLVTVHTTTPSIWFASAPISGQSLDNLAPSEPSGISAAYSGGQTDLQWSANSEPDLGSYRVYRGTSAGFTPGPDNLIASPTSPHYADVGPAGSFYKLSATDVNGNESGFALITPSQTTGVEEGAVVAFALNGARPNPARAGRLQVAFALPSASPALLELHDVSGRRVIRREVGSLGAGRHVVDLADGHRVAPGIYWVSLQQGTSRQRTRLAVIE